MLLCINIFLFYLELRLWVLLLTANVLKCIAGITIIHRQVRVARSFWFVLFFFFVQISSYFVIEKRQRVSAERLFRASTK